MNAGLSGLVSLCTPATARGGLLAGLFLAGAVGSVAHCAPMCGGFVLGQTADRMARIPAHQLCEWRRLRAGLLVPYHLGRLTTYAALGALAASSVAVLGRVPWFTWLSSALMIVAALVFLSQATARILALGGTTPAVPKAWSTLLIRVTRRIGRDGAADGYLLGLVLGLLPCGFLYGAIFAAAAGGQWDRGAVAMLCFGLGTVPALMAVAIVGQAAGRRWQHAAAIGAPCFMIWNALLLLGAAWMQTATAPG